jgi:hypothetical protein
MKKWPQIIRIIESAQHSATMPLNLKIGCEEVAHTMPRAVKGREGNAGPAQYFGGSWHLPVNDAAQINRDEDAQILGQSGHTLNRNS